MNDNMHEMRFQVPYQEYERAMKLYEKSKTPLKRSSYFRRIFLDGLVKNEEMLNERP